MLCNFTSLNFYNNNIPVPFKTLKQTSIVNGFASLTNIETFFFRNIQGIILNKYSNGALKLFYKTMNIIIKKKIIAT